MAQTHSETDQTHHLGLHHLGLQHLGLQLLTHHLGLQLLLEDQAHPRASGQGGPLPLLHNHAVLEPGVHVHVWCAIKCVCV